MAMENNHTNFIHTIDIGGVSYEVHDINAIHTLADLANLGMNTEGIFSYKGTVNTYNRLPTTGNAVGHVYHVIEDSSEYVWDGQEWEEFGKHIVVNHTHSVTIIGANEDSNVTGTAIVTGGNSASAVTGHATFKNIPDVTVNRQYLKLSTGEHNFVKSYPGETSNMVTASVISKVTPSTGTVTGVSGSTTASKATAGTAVAVAKAGTAVSIPNVTANTSVSASKVKTNGSNGSKGSAASWSASVNNGVLSFSWTTNTPTTPSTIPTFESVTASNTTLGTAISVTPAEANGTITPYTFTNVTVPKAASAKTFVTGVDTDSTNVATGALDSTGTGASVMIGLGTAETDTAVVSASLENGTASDGIYTGDDVMVSTQELTAAISGTAAAQVWTQNTGSISGTAAA